MNLISADGFSGRGPRCSSTGTCTQAVASSDRAPDVITIVNPATEEVAGAVPSMIEGDVDTAVAAARQAFDTGGWPQASPADRAAAMNRLAAAIEARAEDTARLVTAEMGMPITLSRRSNVSIPCGIIRYYAALAGDLSTEEIRDAVSFAGRTVVRHEPAGVAAVIASWSYPLILAFCQLAPRGRGLHDRTQARGRDIAVRVHPGRGLRGGRLPARRLQPRHRDRPGGGDARRASRRGRGSRRRADAGRRKIAAICGETLKPVTLELGGKSAAIVLDDVDLDAAAAELAFLRFANSGQACFTMSRVLAPRT